MKLHFDASGMQILASELKEEHPVLPPTVTQVARPAQRPAAAADTNQATA